MILNGITWNKEHCWHRKRKFKQFKSSSYLETREVTEMSFRSTEFGICGYDTKYSRNIHQKTLSKSKHHRCDCSWWRSVCQSVLKHPASLLADTLFSRFAIIYGSTNLAQYTPLWLLTYCCLCVCSLIV